MSLDTWLLNVVSFRACSPAAVERRRRRDAAFIGMHFGAFVAQPVVFVAHAALIVIALVAIGRWPAPMSGIRGRIEAGSCLGIARHRHPHDRSRRLRATPLLPRIVPAVHVAFALVLRGNELDAGLCRRRATARRLAAFLIFIHANGGAPGPGSAPPLLLTRGSLFGARGAQDVAHRVIAFVAGVSEERLIGIRGETHRERPRPHPRVRIVHGHRPFDDARSSRHEPFDQLLLRRAVPVGGSHVRRFDDERVAFPVATRIAHVRALPLRGLLSSLMMRVSCTIS